MEVRGALSEMTLDSEIATAVSVVCDIVCSFLIFNTKNLTRPPDANRLASLPTTTLP